MDRKRMYVCMYVLTYVCTHVRTIEKIFAYKNSKLQTNMVKVDSTGSLNLIADKKKKVNCKILSEKIQ